MAVFQNGGQNFKGRQLQDFKKGSKREHGNFVHPPFEISESAPVTDYLLKKLYFLLFNSFYFALLTVGGVGWVRDGQTGYSQNNLFFFRLSVILW